MIHLRAQLIDDCKYRSRREQIQIGITINKAHRGYAESVVANEIRRLCERQANREFSLLGEAESTPRENNARGAIFILPDTHHNRAREPPYTTVFAQFPCDSDMKTQSRKNMYVCPRSSNCHTRYSAIDIRTGAEHRGDIKCRDSRS